MKLSKEKKFFTAVLLFYWVGLIVATHIPVPMWVRGMGVSDKTMHVAAYIVLTLLLWLAFWFDIKANWRKFQPWLILVVIFLHGVADELTQHFIAGRSTDPADLCADMLGAAAAMVIITFFTGYNAVMALTVIGPVFLPAIVKAGITKHNSPLESVLYIFVYAIVAVAWMCYLELILKIKLKKFKRFLLYMVLPTASLSFVIIYALLTNKPISAYSIGGSVAIILMTVIERVATIPGRKS
ncbi:MAG: VanZ family protein [Planctomycetaceae bacterium]|nr:VanZ family protein [Planctomycetaceae bacterium]